VVVLRKFNQRVDCQARKLASLYHQVANGSTVCAGWAVRIGGEFRRAFRPAARVSAAALPTCRPPNQNTCGPRPRCWKLPYRLRAAPAPPSGQVAQPTEALVLGILRYRCRLDHVLLVNYIR
jgi:hypothetical protein